jgi:hypothetical protein
LPCRSPAATRTPAANEITAHVYVSEGQPDGKDRTGEQHDAYGEIVGSSWQPGAGVYVLLCGGDKSSQRRDTAKAKRMAKEFEGERAMKKAKAKETSRKTSRET